MSGHALAAPAATTTGKWTVMNGPMKGSVRLISAPMFLIGRSPECEFVIVNDPKCSRRHAQVESSPAGWEVLSLNDKNPVIVNGREVQRSPVQDGDLITVGGTELRFNSTVAAPSPSPSAFPGSSPFPRMPARPTGTAGWSPRKIVGIGVGLVAVVWVMLPGKPKKAGTGIRTEQQVQADIEAANKLREAAEAMALKKLDQTGASQQAQENFVRGFRDYKKGQYERALISFQACLALNPDHVLCNRYIRLAQRRFDELIQYEMVIGRKYRDQNQYRACRTAFRNVMFMIKDVNNPIFQEAKANYEACDSLVEGRF